MAHFILCEKYVVATNMANLFIGDSVRLHGNLKIITYDRNIKFMSHFWQAFWKKFNTSLQFSSAYHLTEILSNII